MNQLKHIFIKYYPAFLLILVVFLSPYKIIIVQGNSMSPTYFNREIVIAKKINNTTNLNKNDVIVAYYESEFIIKRIKKLPFDNIYYLYDIHEIDKKLIDEVTYLQKNKMPFNKNFFTQKLTIPNNSFYLLGDNRELSDDSRRFGPINRVNILYKIIYPVYGDPNDVKK